MADVSATGHTYYPWCRVDLHVRLEDLTSSVKESAQLKSKLMLWIESEVSKSVAVATGESPATVSGQKGLTVSASGVESDMVRISAIQPVEVTVEDNGFRTANTATVRIPWKDAPFMSVMIRSALLDVYMGSATAAQFGQGVLQDLLSSYIHRISPRQARQLIRFRGWVDSWVDSHGDSGDWLELQARDYTALLLDSKVPSGTRVPLTGSPSAAGISGNPARLDNVIRTMIGVVPQVRGMLVQVVGHDPTTLPNVVLNRLRGGITAKDLNKSKSKAGASKKPAFEGASYWDMITDLCVSHGFIPRVNLDRLEIASPRVLYESKGRAMGIKEKNAYEVQEASGTRRFARRMIYGENIEGIRYSRKLGRHTVSAVAAVSFDPTQKDASKRVIQEVYPKQAGVKKAPGGSGSVTIKTITAPSGVTDRKALAALAEAVYEMMARNELVASFSTRDLSSHVTSRQDQVFLNGSKVDPVAGADMLSLMSGDPIEVIINPADYNPEARRFSDLQEWFVRGGPVKAITRLKLMGFSETAAKKMAQLVQRGLPRLFRVRNSRLHFLATEGIQIEVEATNYIDVRANAARKDDFFAKDPATTPTGGVSPAGG